MPRARTRRARVRQVANWLKEKHPVPLRVELRFIRHADLPRGERLFGYAEKISGQRARITIVDASNWPISILVETLLHEWAHVAVMAPARWEARSGLTSAGRGRPRDRYPHDAQWACAYGALIESFWDLDDAGVTSSWSCDHVYKP